MAVVRKPTIVREHRYRVIVYGKGVVDRKAKFEIWIDGSLLRCYLRERRTRTPSLCGGAIKAKVGVRRPGGPLATVSYTLDQGKLMDFLGARRDARTACGASIKVKITILSERIYRPRAPTFRPDRMIREKDIVR